MKTARNSRVLRAIPLLILTCLFSFPAQADFAGGTGESNDPYQIATAEQLISIGPDPNLLDKHYVLVNDIDLDPNLPGGQVFDEAVIAPAHEYMGWRFEGRYFTGTFDGADYVITNLTIITGQAYSRSKTLVGLFGALGSGSVVKNLGVVRVWMVGVTDSRPVIGALAGCNYGGSITNCFSTGTVSGNSDVGGLVAWNGSRYDNDPKARIIACHSSCTVAGKHEYAGGLVAKNEGTIENCYSNGTISGDRYTGGLVGSNGGAISLSDSNATVSGDKYTGGLVGSNGGAITLSDSSATVTGRKDVGGLVGTQGGNLSHCSSTGTVTGFSDVGGLVGYNSKGHINGCSTSAAVSGGEYVGGLMGWNNGGSASQSYSTGTVFGNRSVGGLLGRNEGIVFACYNSGAVTGTAGDGMTIRSVGGLIGNNNGSLFNCYNIGSVSGPESVDQIDQSVGGLVGSNEGSVSHCFWNVETTGLAISAGGIGLTTAEMQNADTYLNAGWDFVDEVNNGAHDFWVSDSNAYPELSTFTDRESTVLEGLGTAQSPYLIEDAQTLGAVLFRPLAHYQLIANIDLEGISWKVAVVPLFGGTFDGNGFCIRNLTVQGTGSLGLFGTLQSGEVMNLGLENVLVEGSRNAGALAGFKSWGKVSNCYSTGTVNGQSRLGGLIGVNDVGSILNCYSMVSVRCESGSGSSGGLVGNNSSGGVIDRCYSAGLLHQNGHVGGLVGYNSTGTVTNCFWDVEASGILSSSGGVGLTTAEMMDPEMIGLNGLANDPNWILDPGKDYPRLAWQGTVGDVIPQPVVDWMDGKGTQQEPYEIVIVDQLIRLGKAGALTGEHFVLLNDLDLEGLLWSQAVIPFFSGYFNGNDFHIHNLRIHGTGHLGFFGKLRGGTVANLGLVNTYIESPNDYVMGRYVGSLVGYNSGGNVSNCSSIGTVSGSRYVGGLVGCNNRGNVSNCSSTGAVNGDREVGGLIGYNYGAVSDCYSTGSVRGGNNETGGLVGMNHGHTVFDSYSTCSVIGGSEVGGLVGFNLYGYLSNCYSTGAVRGSKEVGGLVGSNDQYSISNCYSTGTVTGNTGVGGLAGYNVEGNITMSYSTGTVSGNDYVGGLVGYNGEWGTTSNSFWDIETSGQSTSNGGTGKTTTEMQTASTFLEAGWDFVDETENGTEDIWWIVEGNDYPRLWWELISEN